VSLQIHQGVLGAGQVAAGCAGRLLVSWDKWLDLRKDTTKIQSPMDAAWSFLGKDQAAMDATYGRLDRWVAL